MKQLLSLVPVVVVGATLGPTIAITANLSSALAVVMNLLFVIFIFSAKERELAYNIETNWNLFTFAELNIQLSIKTFSRPLDVIFDRRHALVGLAGFVIVKLESLVASYE